MVRGCDGGLRCGVVGQQWGARRGLCPCLAVGLWEVVVLLWSPQVLTPGHSFCGGEVGEVWPRLVKGLISEARIGLKCRGCLA